jgi:hypothetical protein
MPSEGGGGGGGLSLGFHGLIVATSNEGSGPLACKICPYIGIMRTIPNPTGAAIARKPSTCIAIFLRILNFSDSNAMDPNRPSSVL